MNIGIIGTGNVATNLGQLFQHAGHPVVFGARSLANKAISGQPITTIEAAVSQAQVVILAIPYLAVKDVAGQFRDKLAGKIVVDVTNPLNADWSPVVLGAENSAGEEAARLLPKSRVVKAFNMVFADVMKPDKLQVGEAKLTVFISGNDPEANQTIAQLATDAGFHPYLTGDIRNARYVEAMAHLNIQLAVRMQGGTNAGFLYVQRQG